MALNRSAAPSSTAGSRLLDLALAGAVDTVDDGCVLRDGFATQMNGHAVRYVVPRMSLLSTRTLSDDVGADGREWIHVSAGLELPIDWQIEQKSPEGDWSAGGGGRFIPRSGAEKDKGYILDYAKADLDPGYIAAASPNGRQIAQQWLFLSGVLLGAAVGTALLSFTPAAAVPPRSVAPAPAAPVVTATPSAPRLIPPASRPKTATTVTSSTTAGSPRQIQTGTHVTRRSSPSPSTVLVSLGLLGVIAVLSWIWDQLRPK